MKKHVYVNLKSCINRNFFNDVQVHEKTREMCIINLQHSITPNISEKMYPFLFIPSVQEVVNHFYKKLLHKMGHYFLYNYI